MTEDMIERTAERTMNQLDRLLLDGLLTQEEYDAEVKELDRWCRAAYATVPKGIPD